MKNKNHFKKHESIKKSQLLFIIWEIKIKTKKIDFYAKIIQQIEFSKRGCF